MLLLQGMSPEVSDNSENGSTLLGTGVEEQLLRAQTVSYVYIRILEFILKYRFVSL